MTLANLRSFDSAQEETKKRVTASDFSTGTRANSHSPKENAMTYYVLQKDERKGPYTMGQLRAMWISGALTSETLYSTEGDEDWLPLEFIIDQLEPPTLTQVPSPPKSRGVYIILGLFLGTLGIHNFYAGYHGRGAAQLIITLLLGWIFIGLAISGLWALIEICTIRIDANGEAMT